jgi:putative transposase
MIIFFRRVKNGEQPGFPRFKNKERYKSFILKQTGWKLEGRYLTVKNLGRFKLYLHRPIEGDIKTITIKKFPTQKWFITFSCDNVPEKIFEETDKSVGIDMGVKTLCVDSAPKVASNIV